jgi:cytochrome c oxidase cbb3-type subunit 3
MGAFESGIWDLYIGVMTLVSIAGCAVFLKLQSVRRPGGGATSGHVWDEDLTEYNNPLPRWWAWLFYLTIGFSLIYLVLYPGLGSYPGTLGWTQVGQLDDETRAANARFGPLYERYAAQDVPALARNAEALVIGQKLFLNHCAQCHAADARGGRGFPNLADRDWLYGGEPEAIKASITNGRNGVMPALGAAIGGDEGARDVAHYLFSLAGRTHDGLRASRGKAKFQTVCAACHGPDGKGNKTLGAPNLTDDVWLYGGAESSIIETILKGRGANQATAGQSVMPAHKEILSPAKIHLLTGYVYSLSQDGASPVPPSDGAGR